MQADSSKYLMPGAVIIAALLIVGAIVYDGHSSSADGNMLQRENGAQTTGQQAAAAQQQGNQNQTGLTPSASDISQVNTNEGDPQIGSPSAPVVIAYWSDYQCPFCKQFDQGSLSQIYTNYVQTGKVRVVFKDFQFLGPDSMTAALIARAIWQYYPDKYYQWRVAMFNAQDEENSGFGDQQSVLALTKTISGIDVNTITKAVTDNQATYTAAINRDKDEGSKMQVNGTPGIIVGKDRFAGAVPYSQISQVIDQLLK